jgi:DNA segregation ATPase FtsK/SpoIIIE, S-DNA-T family
MAILTGSQVTEPDALTTDQAESMETHRDLQRAALRDLVTLSTTSTAIEAEIEQKYKTTTERAKRELDHANWSAEQRHRQHTDVAQQTHDRAVADASSNFVSQREAVLAKDKAIRTRIAEEYKAVETAAMKEYDQAAWLAQSVYDATQIGCAAEIKKAAEELETRQAVLTEKEHELTQRLAYYARSLAAVEESTTEVPQDAASFYLAHAEEAEKRLAMFHDLRLPRIFSGNTPVLVVLLLAVFTVIGVQAFSKTPLVPDWQRIGIGAGVVLVVSIILGVWLRRVADRQLQAAFGPLRIALDDANHTSKALHDREVAAQEKRLKEAAEKFDVEIRVAKDKRVPVLANANRARDAALVQAKGEQMKQIGFVEAKRNRATAEAAKMLAARKAHLDAELKKELDANNAKANARLAEYRAIYDKEFAALKDRWTNGLAEIQKPIHGAAGGALLPWEESAWKEWKPPKQFPALVRFGELRVDLRQITDKVPQKLELPATFSVPGALAFPEHGSLLINTDQAGRNDALRALHNLIVRLLTTLPPGRARFTFIDPIGLGKNFAGFMHLADYDEALVGGRIWVESEQIDRQLTDLAEHMETVIQKYLRNEFETIDDYNAQAGELAEPYRFLVIADLPVNFSQESMRRLASVVSSGPRCGVYVLCMRDTRQPLPQGSHLDELEAHSVNLVRQGDRFVWADEVFRQFPLFLDEPPSEEFLTKLLHMVGQAAKESKRVEVSFDTIAPTVDKLWSMSTKDELSVPVGRLGATRLQMLKLGRGVAQHVLIAGKTGSGKSTMLHALVTNLSMWYSPEEVEFYLVDFKKGVEFKTYATHHLPHARAIAVESDREFGLSVLQRLDAELTRRGNLYRKLGVQDLPAFRAQSPGVAMPRTLLIIDEFQEFFSEDDKLSQEAQLLLDRLVRQGRAFGIHVLLGSQTIGGSSGLARTTIGQMAVRIALQTSEADSHLILGDNNAAARLLSRPGEAIYNDQGGLVEGN